MGGRTRWTKSILLSRILRRSRISSLSRCTICSYALSIFEGLVCRNCTKVYHKYCFQILSSSMNKGLESSDDKDTHWACPDCRECRYCLSFKDKNDMIECSECGNLVHQSCVFAGPANSSLKKKFKCDDCLKCHNCEAAIGEDENIEKSAVKICIACEEFYSNKQYCPICRKAHYGKMKNLKTKKFSKDLFFCECTFWIHEDCDPLLRRNPANLSKARSKEFTYNCPRCRVDYKKRQSELFIEILKMLDTKNFFTQVSTYK